MRSGRSRPASQMAAGDVAYLCDAANRYFRERIELVDVVRTFPANQHGDEPGGQAPGQRRAMSFRSSARQAPLITVFGGDVTNTCGCARKGRLALTPFLPMSWRWTAKAALPAAICPVPVRDRNVQARARWNFSARSARRLVYA